MFMIFYLTNNLSIITQSIESKFIAAGHNSKKLHQDLTNIILIKVSVCQASVQHCHGIHSKQNAGS